MRVPVSLPASCVTGRIRAPLRGHWSVLHDPPRSVRACPRGVDAASDPPGPARDLPRCIFLGKGIFLDDQLDFLRQSFIEGWASVPVLAQELVLREMERLDLRLVQMSNTDKALFALGNKALHELDDPIVYMRSCAAFLAELAKACLATGPGQLFSGDTALPATCSYCRSLFLVTPAKNTCPSCGAPAGG